MTPEERDLYFDLACRAARAAGKFIRERWDDERTVDLKSDNSIVTEMDTGAEAILREMLTSEAPECAILGEEKGVSNEDGEADQRWWMVDPIDGTTNFSRGFPWFAISIALVEHGQPHVAVVYNPVLEHFFAAKLGAGTTLNGRKLTVSKEPALERAVIATGFGVGSHGTDRDNRGHMLTVMDASFAIRRVGAAALDLAAVAAGWFDGFWELGLNPWDTAAGWLLITEAGGAVTDLDGQTPFNAHVPRILATNGRIHQALSALIR